MGASTPASPIVTRFAPSPTGFLHIGGARTALYNWLYAKHFGGKFLLRIEDTDRARSTDEAIAAILDGLSWLGLDWDDEPVFQFSRAERHAQVAHELISRGHAYRCYLTQDELAKMRADAEAEKRPFRIRSPWRDPDPSSEPDDKPYVVRLRAPLEGSQTIADLVQGDVTVANSELDDMVLLRSDGTPTYMLAVVVDDHDMGVTHVIRGDDHLNNAFRQMAVITGMGWPIPIYAHVPLIHGADGAKLSKRHGALGVDSYRDEMGYLPEAVNNYLLKLGWGHGDDEIISQAQAIDWFDVANVGRGAARFDFKKLENLNGHYIREADDARLAHLVSGRIAAKISRPIDPQDLNRLTAIMPVLKLRAKSLLELADGALFMLEKRPLAMDEKASLLLEDGAKQLLSKVLDVLENAPHWEAAVLEDAVKAFAEREGVGLGKVAQPLRAALTGRGTSPGIFDVLIALGKSEALDRIRDQTFSVD